MSTIAVAVIGAGALSAALQPSAPVSKGRRAGRAATASASHAKPRTGEATQREAPVMLAQALKTARDVEPIEADAASKAKQVEETPMPAGAYTISIDPRTIPPSQPDNPLGGSSFSSAQGIVPEQEPNDTPATATPLGGTNAVARGNIYKLGNPPTPAVGDLDYWSFVGAAGDKVYAATMTQWAPSSSTDTTLELFASDGTTIIETDLDDGSLSATSSSIAGATLPAAGTYYLRVRQASNSSRIAPYFLHFRLQSGAPTPETESNDTVATANALPANGWVSGTHGTATDADFYFFNANAGDTIFLSLDADPERDNVQWNPRVGIGLFGDATSLILVVDDASVGSATNPLSEAHFVTVKTTGTYYAYVDTTAQTSGGPTQTYTMSVSIHPATQIGTNCTVYTSADVPKTIGPGATTVDSTITVPGAPRIEDVNVSVTLNHALMADIDAAIVTPAGNENSLFTDIGATATGGQTQLDADFDDEAGIPPVFTALKGAGWQPEVSYRLAWLKGENAGGIWTLRLRDDLANTSGGSLTAWSITVCEPPAPTACAGVPVTVFQTDFEASASGFTHSGTGDQWARGLPTAAPITTCNSGTSCFKTNLAGTYAASSNQDLFSPNISLSGLGAPIRVSWAQRYQIESASFDEYYVDIREPGPTNSKVLFQWLDATMTDSVGSPATTINETAGWGVVTANADAYANKPAVQLHWNLAPDSSVNLAGVAIDDVTVTACCTAASCNDNNPCTDDLCDAALGCVHTNNTASCSDGNPCTGPDVCSGGVCVAGPNPCNDGNPCTNDICDGAGGCTYTTVNCDDANPCTDDSCTPASGCVHANNAAPCSDGNVCTLGDVCSGGSCVPGPLPARVAFCSNSPITIPAGAPTTTSGISSPYPASISVSTGPIVCSVTVDLQNVTHTFIADVDVLLAAPAGQNAIVMSDVGGTTAVAGVNLTLDDAAANSLPGGTIVSGTYKPTNITAGDTFAAPAPAPLGGSALSVFNATNPNGTWNLWVVDDATGDVGSINSWCVNIAAICAADTDCNDGNPCTDDSCSGGACVHTNNTAPCNDNNACTSNDTCSGGVCVGGPPPSCDDGDACTTDSCNPATGLCEHALVVCNDNNPCTDDTCVSPGGCVFTNNNANACSDNNGCTQTDACVDGTCVGSNPVNCDDGNVCTDDSCTPATGACVHAPNTNACDDGNACTTGDACGPTTSTNTSENFDGVTAPALPAGWTTSQTGTGSLWTTVSTSSDTAPNSAFGADGATVSDEVLVSPPVAITSPVSTATFRARWSFETSSGNCYDSSVLEISFNGGPFADIVTAGGSFAGGGYSGTTNAGFSNPLAGRAAWCFASTGYPNYLTVTVNLPASAAGQSIQLRWRVGTDSSTSATGYNIDTLVITETFQQCQPGTPVNCDDGNACTNDSCDPFAGCVHAAINCGDNDPCTNDSCDPQTGCVNTPITAPPEVNGIAVASDKTTFSWGGALYATAYDVVRGELSGLPVGPGGGDEICFDDLAGTSLNDASVPAVGGSYWYLARGENSCGLGTWGNATAGPRVTTTCP
jgi:subtilisin-like proprotein convertase family protein